MSQQQEEWTWKAYFWTTVILSGYIIGFIHYLSTTPFEFSFTYYWGLLAEVPAQFILAFVYLGFFLYIVILTWMWNPRY